MRQYVSILIERGLMDSMHQVPHARKSMYNKIVYIDVRDPFAYTSTSTNQIFNYLSG